jgi:hypothetical protein
MPNPVIRLLNRFKIWRMQRRGDALVDAKPFFDTMIDLADEIIQEPRSEIPRDLFIMLAYVFAAKEGQGGAHGHFEILRHIRERAWLGYKDAPALGALIVSELPRSEGAVRMKRYFEEIAAKRCSCLFLPAVFGVDRHQGKPFPNPLLIDGIFGELGHMKAADLVRDAFAHYPNLGRARSAFLAALCINGWGRGMAAAASAGAIPAAVATTLRALYDNPTEALAAVKADIGDHPGATMLVRMAEQVSAHCPWLWLQALFIAERWCVGELWFDTAFEIEGGSPEDILAEKSQPVRSGF